MHKLLNKLYKIPNSKDLYQNPEDFVNTINRHTWHTSYVKYDGTNFVYNEETIYDRLRRSFPNSSTLENYLDIKFISNFFKKKYNVDLSLDIIDFPYDYEDYKKLKMNEAPASINLDNGKISFNYPVIYSHINKKLLTFYYFNKDMFEFHKTSDIVLLIILYLLDHELGHLFFSPNEEQLKEVYDTFIKKNPEFKNFTFEMVHRLSNFVEDMYIEDKFKSAVYPNDPSIHLVYDIGRWFLRG
jgi:hypothetical protein